MRVALVWTITTSGDPFVLLGLQGLYHGTKKNICLCFILFMQIVCFEGNPGFVQKAQSSGTAECQKVSRSVDDEL